MCSPAFHLQQKKPSFKKMLAFVGYGCHIFSLITWRKSDVHERPKQTHKTFLILFVRTQEEEQL